jgi:predicted transcriptional regulator
MIAAKRYLLSEGQRLLPFIIGGRIDRLISRKTVNKKILQRMEISELFPKVIAKYNNTKIQEEIIFKIISQILSSSFSNIDYYDMSLNGIPIKTQTTPELIVEEVLQFILLI